MTVITIASKNYSIAIFSKNYCDNDIIVISHRPKRHAAFPPVVYITQLPAAGLGCMCVIWTTHYDVINMALFVWQSVTLQSDGRHWIIYQRVSEQDLWIRCAVLSVSSFARAQPPQFRDRAVPSLLPEPLLETWMLSSGESSKVDWAKRVVLHLYHINADQSVSTKFRPLSTRVLHVFKPRDLNP